MRAGPTSEPECARCMRGGPLFPAPCSERPELLAGAPLGMYHCPECGAMVMAGVPHPPLCARCDRAKVVDDCKRLAAALWAQDSPSVLTLRELHAAIDRLRDPATLLQDAERYRKVRAMTGDASPMCVVIAPKQAVKLGHACPSGDWLDSLVDAAPQPKPVPLPDDLRRFLEAAGGEGLVLDSVDAGDLWESLYGDGGPAHPAPEGRKP